MSFTVGNVVRCRGRQWVVQPDTSEDPDTIILKPLGGTAAEKTGIYLPLEKVVPDNPALPDPSKPGDYLSSKLLRDATRLSLSSSVGPFRCIGRIAVQPRPYQLVPLLMALRLQTVRILVGDDVGIGKTVESLLIARELLDRGEITRISILCPPQLAEQWQREMESKFHLDATLVLSSTAKRLERDLAPGESIFDRHPVTIVSLDYIKAKGRRDDFVRQAPECIIVDEAHACADSGGATQQQRHELVTKLGIDPDRHLILVTATPHTGKDEAFSSLLGLLKPEFATYPTDLSGEHNRAAREKLARHLVQRRRDDIRHFLGDTNFPDRYPDQSSYKLSPQYWDLFSRALDYCRSLVADRKDDTRFKQRVRWWSALALLRTLASSPAAAVATLESRAQSASAETSKEADAIGLRAVMDATGGDDADQGDANPGAVADDSENSTQLKELARSAEALLGKEQDPKLKAIIPIVKRLIKDGFAPILFCRFIETADYLARELREALPKKVTIESITGRLTPAERENRVEELSKTETPILVATDCLSEGVNLQQSFNAVIHYDLAWNPTRHEQREGRVDRFGQKKQEVRVTTFFCENNRIDGIMFDILIEKQRRIRSALGISIPLPVDSEEVVNAVMEGLLLREQQDPQQSFDFYAGEKRRVDQLWDTVAEQENKTRTIFRQEALKPNEVIPEWEAVKDAIGTSENVAQFMRTALRAHNGVVNIENGKTDRINLMEADREIREIFGETNDILRATYDNPTEGATWLSRSHPLVDSLASFILNSAADEAIDSAARRCGVIPTTAVANRTVLLLLRFRFELVTKRGNQEHRQIAEECHTAAFQGTTATPHWLDQEEIETILNSEPSGNIPPDLATHDLEQILAQDKIDTLRPAFEALADEKADELLTAHRRVRDAAAARGSYSVSPVLPVDIIGLYIYQPQR